MSIFWSEKCRLPFLINKIEMHPWSHELKSRSWGKVCENMDIKWNIIIVQLINTNWNLIYVCFSFCFCISHFTVFNLCHSRLCFVSLHCILTWFVSFVDGMMDLSIWKIRCFLCVLALRISISKSILAEIGAWICGPVDSCSSG